MRGETPQENRSSAECRFRRSRANEWSGRRVERVESGTRQTCLAITEKLKRRRQPLCFRGFFRNTTSRTSIRALPGSSRLRFLSPNFSHLLLSASTRSFPVPFSFVVRCSLAIFKKNGGKEIRGATEPEWTIFEDFARTLVATNPFWRQACARTRENDGQR